ncbi:LacI family DNA-binding transcriptional regulator [Martelella lutilitoris]|uniref:LacI family DNA-binding transcriptional regulator n=1 Tax=Martelella lutilitoris TaxID=2583532 RepID=UPI001FE46589|nr:LacI family DNA-binding transcriptional regulator [Martelella lutilitoris]
MARVTIQTIAEETGLSKFAVSRALSGKSGVSEATRLKVAETADRLGYRKAPASSKLLGVVFDDNDVANTELHMQIQNGVQREAQILGYALRIRSTRNGIELKAMAEECSGLLIVGLHSQENLKRLHHADIPIVRNSWLEPLEPVDQVGATDHEAGSAVGRFLLKLGHRRIVYVHGDPRYRGRMERLYGLREVCEREPGVVLHDLIPEEGRDFGEAFDRLAATIEKPTAFFCAHDGLALTVISELLARGYRIPRDASVVGFGDYSAAQQILPQLTTVKVPGVDIGRMATRVLHQRITNQDFPDCPLRLHVPCRIIERQSTGPAPA